MTKPSLLVPAGDQQRAGETARNRAWRLYNDVLYILVGALSVKWFCLGRRTGNPKFVFKGLCLLKNMHFLSTTQGIYPYDSAGALMYNSIYACIGGKPCYRRLRPVAHGAD